MFEKFSQWFDRGSPSKAPEGRVCDHPSCQQGGEYRAPKSRQQLEQGRQDWLWFCLEHIRQYNAGWNYYAGMNEKEQLRERLDDVVWQRPSWPLGDQRERKRLDVQFDDPLGIFEQWQQNRPSTEHGMPPNKQKNDDLELFDLREGFSKAELQQRYRLLAKKYHPDANQSPEAAEKFHQVKEAYERLKVL